MSENEKHVINEDELKKATGGGLLPDDHCWFKATGAKRTDTDTNGSFSYWKECSANCFSTKDFPYRSCACHGQKHCVNKWHFVTADGKTVNFNMAFCK